MEAETEEKEKCQTCGSVIVRHDKHCNQRSASKTEKKKRTLPKMLRFHAARVDARIAMLAACPGIGPVRATEIVKVYPTFTALRAAGPTALAKVVVKKSSLGPELAEALQRVIR